jgi:hypothetical protein
VSEFVAALRSMFHHYQTLIIFGITAAIAVGIAFFWTKHAVRLILTLVTIGLILAVILYWREINAVELDERLPTYFMQPYFQWWLMTLSLVALYAAFHLVSTWIRVIRGSQPDESGEAPKFPDLDSAWEEIQNRLSQARYDMGQQKLFLIIAPDESLAAAWVQASGRQFFAIAPVAEESPIHAYATADGLFLSCAGASAWGRADDEGSGRLENLCRKILALNPDLPVLRGVAVLYPFAKAGTPELLQKAGALRNDLQTIRTDLKVRCPTLAVLCLHESYSGFDEFAVRMPVRLRLNRSGFSVPPKRTLDRPTVTHGLKWFAQWFFSWSLNLMKEDFQNKEGNGKLVSMNAQLWRDLERLCNLFESSFSTHARAEPILVRGCYFSACGPVPENHAFVAGLIKGEGSKMVADAPYTEWSRDAVVVDRRYRLASLGLGLATAAIALPIWYDAVIGRLKKPGVNLPWLGWLGLIGLSALWLGGLLVPFVREWSAARTAK